MDLSKDAREPVMRASKHTPQPIDLWVKRDLAERYASVLREPLPQEWLALLKPETVRESR